MITCHSNTSQPGAPKSACVYQLTIFNCTQKMEIMKSVLITGIYVNKFHIWYFLIGSPIMPLVNDY